MVSLNNKASKLRCSYSGAALALWISLGVLVPHFYLGQGANELGQPSGSVVRVLAHTPQYTMCGSGVIVSSEGYILTAAHLLENAQSILIVVGGSQVYEAEFFQAHPGMDLALLRIPASGLKPLRFRVPLALRDGEEVWVWGYPECSEEIEAVRCSVGQTEANLPQGTVWYDAPIERGYSGGPVLDTGGNLVAMHFEQPVAEGGGRGVSAQAALAFIPSGIPFLLSLSGNLVTVKWVPVNEPGGVSLGWFGVGRLHRKG